MAAQRIEGKPVAEQIKNEVRDGVAQLLKDKGVRPGLGVILVGEDPASQTYVNSKGKACADLGMHSETLRMPANTSEAVVIAQVNAWNADSRIHGILVQMPLPKHINEQRVIETIDPRKDVDGFHPVNVGKLVIGMECLCLCILAGI